MRSFFPFLFYVGRVGDTYLSFTVLCVFYVLSLVSTQICPRSVCTQMLVLIYNHFSLLYLESRVLMQRQ